MLGRVAFLLYLPAMCFSFAIFPNDGHVAQRRQNPEEDIANLTYSQDVEPCIIMHYPCINTLFENLAFVRSDNIVVDGRLTVQCKSNLLEESRSCVNAASQCYDGNDHDEDVYRIMLIMTLQRIWEFLCQHSEALVAGEDCWSSLEFYSATNGCNPPCISTCIRESMANMTECSTEESILMSRFAGVMMGETEGTC